MPVSTRFASTLLVSLLNLAVIGALCYLYVDRPLSLYLESLHLAYIPALRQIEYLPVWTVYFSLAALLLTPFLSPFLHGAARRWAQVALRVAVTAGLATFIKNELKGIFGRYWTRTWVCNNPSLNGTGDYAFNWFHSGPQFGSFPSGHACVITAAATAVVLCFPHKRAVKIGAFITSLCSAGAVLAQNFHFLGDIIAGAWLGVVSGLVIGRLWPDSVSQSLGRGVSG